MRVKFKFYLAEEEIILVYKWMKSASCIYILYLLLLSLKLLSSSIFNLVSKQVQSFHWCKLLKRCLETRATQLNRTLLPLTSVQHKHIILRVYLHSHCLWNEAGLTLSSGKPRSCLQFAAMARMVSWMEQNHHPTNIWYLWMIMTPSSPLKTQQISYGADKISFCWA